MGAWIETTKTGALISLTMSLPTWGRGLKLYSRARETYGTQSLPTWGRGLKLGKSFPVIVNFLVAPYMGAWIETMLQTVTLSSASSRSLHGGVD